MWSERSVTVSAQPAVCQAQTRGLVPAASGETAGGARALGRDAGWPERQAERGADGGSGWSEDGRAGQAHGQRAAGP